MAINPAVPQRAGGQGSVLQAVVDVDINTGSKYGSLTAEALGVYILGGSTGGGGGVTSQTVQGADANGAVPAGNPVLVAGSDGTNLRTIRTDTSGDVIVVGNVASATTDSGNPVKIGGFASTSAPGAVTAGQRANAWLGLNGQQFVAIANPTGAAITTAFDNADSIAVGSLGLVITSRNMIFNGTTWDRQRKPNIKSRLTSSAAGGSPTNVKTTAGDLGGFAGQNGAAITYVHLYDKASAPVVGTDTPILTFPVPVNTAFSSPSSWASTYFANGVAYAFTTDAAGTTGAAAAAVTSFGLVAA